MSQWYLTQNNHTPWAILNNAFTPLECDLIKSTLEKYPQHKALVDTADENTLVRKNTLRWANSTDPDTHWIYQRLTDQITAANQQVFKFDIDYIECLQYTEYLELGDRYEQHVDMQERSLHNRKLSFSLQLTDPTRYKGSDLEFITGYNTAQSASRQQGALIVFPSYQMHRVTPLLEGQRISLVGWVAGPHWR